MIPKGYLWLFRFICILALFVLGFVVMYVDPENEIWAKGALYTTIFVFFASLFNLIFLRLRRNRMQGELVPHNMALSFRQGILLALLVVMLMVLQSFRMLIWWDGLLAAGAIFLIEFYFLSRN